MNPQKLTAALFAALFVLAGVPGLSLAQDGAELRGLTERVEELEKKTDVQIGGALRAQYGYQDWSETSKDKGGDFAFDTFRLNVDGTVSDMIISAEYRFYPEYDFDTIHHGYIGYDFTEDLQGQVGVQQVPFGIQPYASHNFWFSGAYYVGLEDDYDMGVKLLYSPGPWDVTVAFYKNGELGDPSDKGRYSTDQVTDAVDTTGDGEADTFYNNEETNQGNLRVAYTFDHGDSGSTEFGLSGEFGESYNASTGGSGDHWAGAAHMVGNYGNWNVQLEYAAYEYDLADPVDPDVMRLGGYSFAWNAPTEAQIGIANIAYTVPMELGPIDSVTFYSDNTVIEPEADAHDTAWQNVVGALVASGPVYTYLDVISGENMIFMGGNPTTPDNDRRTRININFGYYF